MNGWLRSAPDKSPTVSVKPLLITLRFVTLVLVAASVIVSLKVFVPPPNGKSSTHTSQGRRI